MQRVLSHLVQHIKQNPLKFTRDLVGIVVGEKSFEKNRLLADPLLNEKGLHQQRVVWVHKLANWRRKKLIQMVDAQDAAFFEKNGYIVKENFLAEHEFAQLKDELLSTTLNTREMLQGNTVSRRMSLDAVDVKHLPMAQKFLKNQDWTHLLNLISGFKVQPMNYVQVIFAKINAQEPDPQTHFHSDTFYSSAKAWLFLSDVDDSIGPFMYVPGSHRADAKRLHWEYVKSVEVAKNQNVDGLSRRGSFRITPQQLKEFGFAEPIKFNVKANTLLIADTFGFHARGESASSATRAEIWAYARRNPMIPFVSGHYLALPWIRQRSVSLYWKALDLLENKNIKRSPWRNLGKMKVADPAQITSIEAQNR